MANQTWAVFATGPVVDSLGRGPLLEESVSSAEVIERGLILDGGLVVVPTEHSGEPVVTIDEATTIARSAFASRLIRHRHELNGDAAEYSGLGGHFMTHVFRVYCASCNEQDVVPPWLSVEIDVTTGAVWDAEDFARRQALSADIVEASREQARKTEG